MQKRVCQEIKGRLPYECPTYSTDDPKFRRADAALIYLLQLETLEELASTLGLSKSWKIEMERDLLNQILSLSDPTTGGISRYIGDSYQRHGYFRTTTVRKLSLMYGSPSGDASSNFHGRDLIVPRGPEAGWSHFCWQLSSWAGERYLKSSSPAYDQLHLEMLRNGLKMITGFRERTISLNSAGHLTALQLKPFRIPECIVSETSATGQNLRLPSPHTPLFWSVAESFNAFRIARLCEAKRSRSKT